MNNDNEPNSCGGGSTASQLSYPKLKNKATYCGQDYEVALCSLFFLRALSVSSDFFLASNYEPAGKFDDVVLFYRLKEDSDPAVYRAIFLQAKHQENTKGNTLKIKELQGYLESFTPIKNLCKQPLDIDGRQITRKDVSLVHYTNTGCAVDTVKCDVDDLPDLQMFLNTGGLLMRIPEAPEIEHPQGEDTSDFLEKLLICTQQMSVKTADKFLLHEMCKLLGLESRDVGRELTSELKSMVKAWWSAKDGTFLTANSEGWQRILQKQITRLNGDTLAVDSRMNLAFTAAALKELDVVSRRMKMTWIPVSDTHQASMTRVRLLKARSESLVLGAKYLDSHCEEVEALWGKSVCQTLAIDLTDYPQLKKSELLQRLQEAVAEMDARRHLVVVATEQPPSEGWTVVEPQETWSALKPQTQQRLLSLKVQLQGIPDVELRNVVGSNLSDVMIYKVIKSLSVSQRAIELGRAMLQPHDYYVPQCLQRTCSKTISYQSLQNTNTLLSYYEWDYSSSVDINIQRLTINDLLRRGTIDGLVILDDQASDSEIRNLCSKFRVKGFRGRAERKGLTGEVTEFIPLTWIFEDDLVVVEGLPGVGKSSYVTQMCFVAKEEFPECWVLRVDMASYTEYLKGANFASQSDVIEFLLKAFNKDLERHLLEHTLRVTGNIFLFLDAFDEVSPDFTDKCCRLLKRIADDVKYRQMVVTTRPVTTKAVEKELETKAFILPVFSREEQELFFKNFCRNDIDNAEITSIQQIAGDVIKIPLLCKMSADVLMNSQDKSVFQYKDPWRRALLYHLFVVQTIQNRFTEKFGLEISKPALRKLLESNSTHHLRDLQGLAVRKLMPNTKLSRPYDGVPEEKFGLVVNTEHFEHETFAEFFLGCWLSDNWQSSDQQKLRRLLLNDRFHFVASTLSWCLFQDLPPHLDVNRFPLHLAVARGDAEAVREELLLPSAGTTDRGGRSALHVAAMTPGCSRDILEMLVDSVEDLNMEDDILATPAVEYAEVAKNWDFLEVMAGKGARLENLNFFKNPKEKEKVLIQAIQRDLANFTNCVLELYKELLGMTVGYDRDTLLHIAALNNSTRVLKVLIQRGFEINVKNRSGSTALRLAAREGLLKIVKFLIRKGADNRL